MNGSINQSQRGLSYLFTLAAFVIVAFGIKASQEILQPLLLSFFIAVVCVPVYAWLVSKKVASWLALLLVIAGMLAVTLVVFWIVMTSLADFTSRQDHYAEQLRLRTKPLRDLVERLVPEQPAAAEAELKPVENLLNDDSKAANSLEVQQLLPEPTVGKPSTDTAGALPGADAGNLQVANTARSDGNAGLQQANRANDSGLQKQLPVDVEGDASGSSGSLAETESTVGLESSVEVEASVGSEASGADAESEQAVKGSREMFLNAADDSVGETRDSDGQVSEDGEVAVGSDTSDVGSDITDADTLSSEDTLSSAFHAGRLFQSKTQVTAPKSRRSWKQLIMAQFDPGMALSLAATLASTVSQVLSNSLLIILTVVFILLEASSFPRKLTMAFGAENNPGAKYQTIVDSIRSYIVLKTGISIITGILVAAWLWLFGVPYAGLWGMLAFLLNYIPNVGSIIAAIPALLVAWLDLGLSPCLGCAIGYAAINIAVGNLLEPRLLGRGLGLSPLVIFCSMLFWGWALGPVGMLLSVPLTMGVRVGLEGFEDTRWMGVLLGNADP